MSNGTIKTNAPEVQAFIDVIWAKAATGEDNVSTRIAQSLIRQPNWPPRNLETHRQIVAYQRQLTSQYLGKINRGGLGHLWSEAYKRTVEPVQIDIEEQIAAQEAEEKAAADMGYKPYSSAEKNTIKRMYADGVADAEIAKSLGRSIKAIRLQRLRLGLTKWVCRLWSETDDLALQALLNSGHSKQEIAAKLGRTIGSVDTRVSFLKRASLLQQPAAQAEPVPQPAPPPAPTPPPTPAPAPAKPKSWWRRLFG